MQPFLDNPALRLFATIGALVAVQLVLIAFWTGTVRAGRKVFVNAEDAKLNKGANEEQEHRDVLRVKRAHMNALENAVPFFVVGLLYALSNPTMTGAKAYYFTFLGARVLHTFFYLRGLQPFRTICFALGALATIGMAYHVVVAAM